MKALYTFFLIVAVFSVSAQDGVMVKYYDSSWHPTSKENATYYIQFVKEDTLYKCTSYYAKSNKLYEKSTFADILLSIGKERGLLLRYYESGKLKDSAIYNNYGRPIFYYSFFENCKLKIASDSIDGMGRKYRYFYPSGAIKDSTFSSKKIHSSYKYKFTENGICDTMICFDKDSNALVKSVFDTLGNLISRKRLSAFVYNNTQSEAEFPAGQSAWKEYLEHHLRSDLPLRNGAPKGKYTVIVNFIVEKDGSISEIMSENNPGYGTSEEAMRVVSEEPKWKPAIQNGHAVNYRARQQITFVVN